MGRECTAGDRRSGPVPTADRLTTPIRWPQPPATIEADSIRACTTRTSTIDTSMTRWLSPSLPPPTTGRGTVGAGFRYSRRGYFRADLKVHHPRLPGDPRSGTGSRWTNEDGRHHATRLGRLAL